MELNKIVDFNTWTPKKKPDESKIAKKIAKEENLKRRIDLSLDELCILSIVLTKGTERTLKRKDEGFYPAELYLKLLQKIVPEIANNNAVNDTELLISEEEIETILAAIEDLPNPSLEQILSRNFKEENAVENTIAYMYATLRYMYKMIHDKINRIKGIRDSFEESLKAIAEYIPSIEDGYNDYLETMKYRKEEYEKFYLSRRVLTIEEAKYIQGDNENSKSLLVRFYISPLRDPYERYNHSKYEGNINFDYLDEDYNDKKYGSGWRLNIKYDVPDSLNIDVQDIAQIESLVLNELNSYLEVECYKLLRVADREENLKDKLEILNVVFNSLENIDSTASLKMHEIHRVKDEIIEYIKAYIYKNM